MKTEELELIKFEDWERLFNAAIDPLMLLDLDGKVITLNDEAVKLLDKSVDELIGWNSYDFMAPNESKFFKAQINNIARLRKPVRVEKELFGRTFDHSLSPIFDEQGKVEQVVVFFHDITERKKIEEQLIIKSKAIESSNNAIAFADLKGKLIYGNLTFLKEWGYSNINEVIGKHVTTFWHKEEETREVIKGLQNEGEWFGELVARRKNRKIFNAQVSASMVIDDFGELICMMASSIDITERKRAEELLKESEKKHKTLSVELETIIDLIPGIVFCADKNGIITRVNQTAAEFHKLKKKDFIGKTVSTLYPKDQAKKMRESDLKVLDSGKPLLNLEQMVDTPYGKKWLSINKVPHRNEDNKVDGIIGLVIDITERKKLEQKLKESEIMHKSFFENSGTEITIVNKDGICLLINDQAAKRFNGKPNDFVGKSLFDMFPKEIAEGYFKSNLKIIETGKGKSEEKTFNTPTGERTFIISTQPVANYEGINSYIVINALDITERKKNEVLLKESEEAYQEAYNRMLLYQSLITHDIRNVLTSVQTLTYLYNRYRNNPAKVNEMNDVLKMINEQIVKGDILIRNVINLSDLETKLISLKPLDVLNVLEESIKFLRNSFLNRDISIQVDSVSNEFVAQADDFLIDVFENILNNAVKHNINPIAEILIRIAKEERGMKKFIQFEFIDNGNGISDNRKQLIFQRNHPKKEYVKSLGIGLSLVFKIIENYGGEIWVEDKVKGDSSKGSKFVILIPEAY